MVLPSRPSRRGAIGLIVTLGGYPRGLITRILSAIASPHFAVRNRHLSFDLSYQILTSVSTCAAFGAAGPVPPSTRCAPALPMNGQYMLNVVPRPGYMIAGWC